MVTNVCWVGTVESANVQSPTFLLFLKQITNWHLRVLDFSLVLGIVLCENYTDIFLLNDQFSIEYLVDFMF